MRVLVVEDERHLAGGIKRGLEAEGFAVDIAFDGPDGLERATEGDYDAIVLDIMLPGMNGYKICSTLREGGNWTPIIMLTAKDGELDEAEALDTGADDFLSKPFSYIVLVARIRALLRRNQPGLPPMLAHGNLTFDPGRQVVFRAGQRLPLSPKELAVLELLLTARGRAVSGEELLERAWDAAADPFTNTVKVTISRLRRKLGDPPLIETVPQAGYRLVGE